MDEIASEESRALLDTRVAEIELPSETPSQLDIYLSNVQNRNLYLAVFTAVLGPLSFGFVLGYSSPSIPELKQSSNPELRLDNNQASWFGSVVTLGAAAGGILGGYVVDKVGRKLSLMSCAVPFVVGFLAIVCAQNIWMLYTGRLLTGLASGVTSLVVPVYISEVAHSRVRGMLGSCVQLMVVTGILGAYLAAGAECGRAQEPRHPQAVPHRHGPDVLPAGLGDQRHHVLRGDHLRGRQFQGRMIFARDYGIGTK